MEQTQPPIDETTSGADIRSIYSLGGPMGCGWERRNAAAIAAAIAIAAAPSLLLSHLILLSYCMSKIEKPKKKQQLAPNWIVRCQSCCVSSRDVRVPAQGEITRCSLKSRIINVKLISWKQPFFRMKGRSGFAYSEGGSDKVQILLFFFRCLYFAWIFLFLKTFTFTLWIGTQIMFGLLSLFLVLKKN